VEKNDVPEKVLESVDECRRSFVRKLLVTSAFVVPTVMSFRMSGLGVNEASAQTGNMVKL